MRTRIQRLINRGNDTGASGGGTALMMLILSLGLFMILGLVVDGGSRAQALDRADRIANEAARAGLQAAVITNGSIDIAAVEPAVQQYLSTEGVTGTVTVSPDSIRVHVTSTTPTKVLGIIGISTMTITGDGKADVTFQ